MLEDRVSQSVDLTAQAIEQRADAHWILAFSGGKDSTATLKIFLSAAKQARRALRRATLIYCDTGVENPILDLYVKRLLHEMSDEFGDYEIPIEIRCLKAPPEDRFFVRLIGRGYPRQRTVLDGVRRA